jgi:hypothetical protein
MTVYVHNLDNDTVSDPVTWYLDQPVPGAPAINVGYGSVTQNGDGSLYIQGDNLQGLNEQSFSGVPGLTFSNIQPDPNYPPDHAFWIQVHADATAPLTGDEATNLTVTTGNGQSNPFGIGVLPR